MGGSTIEEAKQRITYAEFQDWITYRKMRGSLFIGNRIESHVGLLNYQVHRGLGGKKSLQDFLPHRDRPNEPVEMDLSNTIAAVMANLNAARVT